MTKREKLLAKLKNSIRLFMTYLTYKGYQGTIEPQVEDGILYGKIAFIRDLVTYEAVDLPNLQKEFETSVDDYLADCLALGKEPNKPFKGSFNVRIDPNLHRAAAIAAKDMSLNAFVAKAIESEVERVNSSN